MSSSSSSAAAAPPVEKPSAVFSIGINGLTSVVLSQPGGYSAEVLLYGGQVISWKNKRGDELLFISKKAVFEPYNPIRGGIPICFPTFINNGGTEQHGFARLRYWEVDTSIDLTTSSDKASIDLILRPTNDDLLKCPNQFEFRLRVILEPNGDLKMNSHISNLNSDGKPFTFLFSYHTYFYVSEIREVGVEGLEKVDYLDYLQNKKRCTEQAEAITFDSEVDRVYLNTPDIISITDRELKRTFTIRKSSSLPDIVVWNPWEEKAREMTDLDTIEYREMVCVEAAAVGSEITLKAGDEWTGTHHLSVCPWTLGKGC
ncbi:hypothetical protein ABFX02_11G024400 [Erythranthe guttata]